MWTTIYFMFNFQFGPATGVALLPDIIITEPARSLLITEPARSLTVIAN